MRSAVTSRVAAEAGVLRRPLVVVAVALAAAMCSVAFLSGVDAATSPEFGYDDGANSAAVVVGSPSAGRLLAMSSPTFLHAQAHSVGFSRPNRARFAPRATPAALDDVVGAVCSFSAATTVVMSDGTRKAISEVEVGDYVLGEDPETGERGPRRVTHVWEHEDTVVDLEIDGDVVTTTEDHPFWSATDREWQEAQELDVGDLVRTAEGVLVEVAGVRWRTARTTTAFNLTVAGIHTYFVGVGEDAVLVHNTCGMLGAHGTQVTSRTLANRPGYRVDVENPAPGVRPGQLHLQDSAGGKYLYDFEAGRWAGLPRSLQRQIVNDPAVARAIATGRRYLGLDP